MTCRGFCGLPAAPIAFSHSGSFRPSDRAPARASTIPRDGFSIAISNCAPTGFASLGTACGKASSSNFEHLCITLHHHREPGSAIACERLPTAVPSVTWAPPKCLVPCFAGRRSRWLGSYRMGVRCIARSIGAAGKIRPRLGTQSRVFPAIAESPG
jgi:hypothetical protein